MITIQTQFDNNRLTSAVATPTCSSCCCCCCCLATSISSTAALTTRINKESKANQKPNRPFLVLIAALIIPISLIIIAVIYIAIQYMSEIIYNARNSSQVYTNFNFTSSSALLPLIVVLLSVVPYAILRFLYKQAGIQHPDKRATRAMGIFSVAVIVEFFIGATLILMGGDSGGFLYFLAVPFVIVGMYAWFQRRINTQVDADLDQSTQQITPTTIQPTQFYQEASSQQDEPPQQNPPTPSP